MIQRTFKLYLPKFSIPRLGVTLISNTTHFEIEENAKKLLALLLAS